MTAYDKDGAMRLVTSAVLGNIQKYTDRNDYELIFIDDKTASSVEDLNERYHNISIDKRINVTEDIGISACRNLGAKKSDPMTKYFCFIDNDVFVWEGWLPKLRSYLESGKWDAIYPHQGSTTREFVKESYKKEGRGNDDAGLILITREAFELTEGWDENFESVYHDLAFRKRMAAAGLSAWCTNQVLITHLGGATTFNSLKFNEKYQREGDILHGRNKKNKN
jgi:GT2 family glycosyltransferase